MMSIEKQVMYEGPVMGGMERARLGLLKVIRVDIREPSVVGEENLPKEPCVVATSHLSDVDLLAVVLAIMGIDQRKIEISSQKTNFDLFLPAIKVLGRDNFYPIQNTVHGNDHASFRLDYADFEGMRDGVREGRTMVIAAHVPTRNWMLHRNAGIGPILLAHMAKVPLVPVAVDINSPTPIAQSTMTLRDRARRFVTGERPNARISFGKPMQLSEITEEQLRPVFDLYGLRRRGIADEQQTVIDILKAEQAEMMNKIAENLPPEKRGVWGRN